MSVLAAADRSFCEVEHVGLAIQPVEGGNLHSGLLYRLAGREPRILHLAFHHRLEDDVAAEPFRWSQLGLDEDNKIVLAVLLSRIAAADQPISYGFDARGICFDPTSGNILPSPPGKGLTCATFIVAVLQTYGHILIDSASWPERDEDKNWQEWILRILERHATAEHVEAVRQDVGAARFRPDEIVAAGNLPESDWPVAFDEARRIADQVVADLN